MFGTYNSVRINAPWKDAEGRWNVVVMFEQFDTISDLHSRAQKWIAMEGVTDGRWPNVPVVLFDRTEENMYHYREVDV